MEQVVYVKLAVDFLQSKPFRMALCDRKTGGDAEAPGHQSIEAYGDLLGEAIHHPLIGRVAAERLEGDYR
jgi:hypothetical protein